MIGNRAVGDGHPTFIVAEMAWSHDGSIDKALAIIDAAADGNADAINLHITSVPDYMTTDYVPPASDPLAQPSFFETIMELAPSYEDFEAMAARARERGLMVSTMCNDLPSLDFSVANLEPDILMIHPSCATDIAFVERVAMAGSPVLLYAGGLTLSEVEQGFQTIRSAGNDQIIIQHGFQSYPTALEDNHLSFIATLKSMFGVPIAFGDHTDGGDPLALLIPALSVGFGADMIEKHLTHDRSLKGIDYQSALDPSEFSTFVAWVRAAESTIGSAKWHGLGDRQITYRDLVRKRATASRDIPLGDVIQREDILFLRANDGVGPEDVGLIIGRRTTRDLSRGEPLTQAIVSLST